MKSTLHSILLYILLISLNSCSNNHENKTYELKLKKLNSTTAQEQLRELLILNNANYEQLACILQNSPSSLKRIENGETFANEMAEKEITKLYTFIFIDGNDLNDIKANCISYSWYNYAKSFMSNWYFWIVSGMLLILLGFILYLKRSNRNNNDYAEYLILPLIMGFILLVILYLIIWVFNYFGGEPDYSTIQDDFKNTLDTTWETLR